MNNQLKTLIRRLKRLGIQVELVGNFPWIYLDSVNGTRVKERHLSNHGFTVAFLPSNPSRGVKLADRRKTFQVVREYLGKVKR